MSPVAMDRPEPLPSHFADRVKLAVTERLRSVAADPRFIQNVAGLSLTRLREAEAAARELQTSTSSSARSSALRVDAVELADLAVTAVAAAGKVSKVIASSDAPKVGRLARALGANPLDDLKDALTFNLDEVPGARIVGLPRQMFALAEQDPTFANLLQALYSAKQIVDEIDAGSVVGDQGAPAKATAVWDQLRSATFSSPQNGQTLQIADVLSADYSQLISVSRLERDTAQTVRSARDEAGTQLMGYATAIEASEAAIRAICSEIGAASPQDESDFDALDPRNPSRYFDARPADRDDTTATHDWDTGFKNEL